MSAFGRYVCRDFVADVTAYLEGALGHDVARRVDAHLTDCPHCREYLAQMRRTITDSGRLGADDIEAMPADLRARLLVAFAARGHDET
jgi:anti-sigma factor RsiW